MNNVNRYIYIEHISNGSYGVFDVILDRALTQEEIQKLEIEYQKHLSIINKQLNQ